MNSRIILRLFSRYLAIVLIFVLITGFLVNKQIKKITLSHIEGELVSYCRVIAADEKGYFRENIKVLADSIKARLTLIDADGRVLADSERPVSELDNHLNRTEVQEARLKGFGQAIRYSQTLKEDMLYVAVPLYRKSMLTGYIRVARPLFAVSNAAKELSESFLYSSLIVVPITLIMALFFSYRLTAPIKAMEKYTEKIRKGEATGILLVNTSDELKKLAGNINYLVDELKNRIDSANEEKGKLVAAFASMAEGVLILNSDHRIEFINRALNEILSPAYRNLEGKTLMEAFRNVDLEDAFHRFQHTRSSVTQQITLPGLKPLILDIGISVVEGLPSDEKTMIVFRDVTRLKALERVRADFVANVTHEIRTPLTAILGYVETLLENRPMADDEKIRFLGIISRQALRLNRLVEDLLTISQIELGEMSFRMEEISLADIMTNVLPVIELKAQEKRIAIHNRLPQAMPLIRGDRDRLTQVFMNILDNAVKFTGGEGSVTIEAEEDKAGGEIAVRISDTGIGIPVAELPRLGERFYRVDKTRSRDMGGTGLGLSIVKHLMQSHGGRMEIASQLGKGTTVTLYFTKAKQDIHD